MDDCEEILRELYPYLDASLSDRPGPRSSTTSTTASTASRCTTSTPSCAIVIARKCREQSVPPGLLARVKDCLGHASRRRRPTAASARLMVPTAA